MSSAIQRYILKLKVVLSQSISLFHIVFARLYPTLKLEKRDLTGKIAIVTGANSGLGYSIASTLAEQNATVYLACRSKSRGEEAATNIINTTGSKNVHVLELDTSSLHSVQTFCASWSKPIHILMHNAGIASTPSDVKVTQDGLGLLYATNLLGSFLMTSLLEAKLTPEARVVFSSSTGAYGGDINSLFQMPKLVPNQRNDFGIYNDTKLMQVAFARTLQQRWIKQGSRRTAHAFTPGYAMTSIFGKISDSSRSSDFVWYLLKRGTDISISSDQGALTGSWLATTDDPSVKHGGDFWDRKIRMRTPVDLLDQTVLDKLWQTWCVDSGAKWTDI